MSLKRCSPRSCSDPGLPAVGSLGLLEGLKDSDKLPSHKHHKNKKGQVKKCVKQQDTSQSESVLCHDRSRSPLPNVGRHQHHRRSPTRHPPRYKKGQAPSQKPCSHSRKQKGCNWKRVFQIGLLVFGQGVRVQVQCPLTELLPGVALFCWSPQNTDPSKHEGKRQPQRERHQHPKSKKDTPPHVVTAGSRRPSLVCPSASSP
jgi:hypothetical protein